MNPEIFKNNWEALQVKYPELCEKLKGTIVGNKYELFQQENCIPNVMEKTTKQPYYVGQIQEQMQKNFKGFELDNVKQAVFLGFGLGYEVMFFVQTIAKEHQTQSIIVIERDAEMFVAAMNVNDLTQIINNQNIYLFVGIKEEELYNAFRTYFSKNLPQLLMCGVTQPLFTHSAMRLNKEYYIRALQIMYESIYHSIQNFGNCPADSLVGLENMLDNVNVIVNNPGINLLYDKFKGKPAIIVATGPSLKKNMHLLKGLEDKALIISCDASFKLLMNNGINPHMVTSLEREHEVQQFFDKFDKEEVKDIYMTTCPVLFNHVYESYEGPKIIVYRNFDHFKWLEIERGILEIKLASSNMAFKIAEALGCDPIILIGQDLAYGENDETHATEVPFSSEGEGIFMIPGNNGQPIKTNSGWYNFLKAYEFDIAQYKGHVINCTEGGAYIQGTEVTTFKDVIETLKDSFNPLEIIKAELKNFTTIKSDLEKLKSKIDLTENETRKIIECCEKGVATCALYKDELKNISPEKLQEIRKQILDPRIEINNAYGKTFQLFLMHVVQAYHLKFEMETIMTCRKPEEILANYHNWYAFVGDICEICLDSLIKAKETLYAGN